jgi:5-(carboxyamino)imidazole ribonucleotide synthase
MTAGLIRPGVTLGMVGGGQLGRMFTIAARRMGFGVLVHDPKPNSPAGQLADRQIVADYADAAALDDMARNCPAVSTEFEKVPAASLERLARDCITRPHGGAVALTQDRLDEKAFFDAHGLPTVAWAAVRSADDVDDALAAVGAPALLKTARGGYDGKGQANVGEAADAAAGFDRFGGQPCILEQRVELATEVSVIVCRSAGGECACYPPGENVHVGGILATTRVPADVDAGIADQAVAIAKNTAAALDYCGVLGVELFVTAGGDVLLNELAPRPHNSGHYSVDACSPDQFEQQVRLLCGFAPEPTDVLGPVAMVNLLGDLWGADAPDWTRVLNEPGAHLHLYGKTDARPGRKMGHVNVLADDSATALAKARHLLTDLGGRPQ